MCTPSPKGPILRGTSSEYVSLHLQKAPFPKLESPDLEEGFMWKNSAIKLSSHCTGLGEENHAPAGQSLLAFYPVNFSPPWILESPQRGRDAYSADEDGIVWHPGQKHSLCVLWMECC